MTTVERPMHAIDTLYQDHLALGRLPARGIIEQHTRRITDEGTGRAVAGRLACALPSAEAIDYLRRHLRAPLLTVAAGTGFWAYCLRLVQGIEALATDLFAPADNPRFRWPGWYPVQPMDALEALRRYPDRDVLGVCLPPGMSLQQVYEAAPHATDRQLFVAGCFSRGAFGGGREGVMSEAHGLRFRRVHRALGPRGAGLSDRADPHLACVTKRARSCGAAPSRARLIRE
jgi:hypothetical protein